MSQITDVHLLRLVKMRKGNFKMELRPARSTRFLPVVLMLVIGLALVGLVMLAVPSTQASPMNVPPLPPTITPTPGVNYEVGNFCVDDYQPGSNCTANDVRIASLEPDLSEVCLAVGDYATVRFKAEIVAGSTERYDIGLFIATEGGSAQTGDFCYHDFLQPVTTGTPELTEGWGPFRETEGAKADNCGDTLQGESNFYFTQAEVTFLCADNNNDGIVDPISTCLSWDNNVNGTCTNVKNAYPSTDAKCRCEPIGTGTIIYRGLDYGDLPDSPYPTLKANSGPFHAVQDANNDGTPDTIGTSTAVWLGDYIDTETDGQPNGGATGDDANQPAPVSADDEDGVTPTINYQWSIANGGSVDVKVKTSDANGCTVANPCKLALYFDWNGDGDFDDVSEETIKTVTGSTAGTTQDVTFPVAAGPGGVLLSNVYARFRLYANGTTPDADIAPTGLVENGEVEDYYIELTPLGVVLLDFSVVCTGGRPEISWETASELYTQGFNVWRNTSSGGPQNKLNGTMIPGHPGSPLGYTYSYLDTTAAYNTTYYFWLEDIDTSGVSTFNGPIDAECQAPTSVGFDTVEANPAAGLPVGALPAAGLLALGAAGAAAVWLKRRRA